MGETEDIGPYSVHGRLRKIRATTGAFRQLAKLTVKANTKFRKTVPVQTPAAMFHRIVESFLQYPEEAQRNIGRQGGG
jgi:hypothetical protein